jgi:hypothetical protein
MTLIDHHSVKLSAGRSQRLKEAVLASFYEPASEVQARLAEFTSDDWERILFWLDISGLALYLLDRLTRLELETCLPEPIRIRLEESLRNNCERTADLFREASAISRKMELQHISFALLKGITLTPESVPDCTLRSQTDLDFLVAASDASAAKSVILEFGYALRALSGKTIEFKAGSLSKPDIRNMYRVHSQRALELHLLARSENSKGSNRDRLARAQARCFHGVMIPALAPADALVQQGLHLFKHLCGEHTRASWVLEFWRYVQSRRNDVEFWNEVRSVAETEPQASIALGASTLLATLAFRGEFAPESLTRWTTDRLPLPVRLWIETYGRRVLMAGSPGNKLYLILRQELPQGREMRANMRRLVFPLHLPPSITHGEPGEGLVARLGRYLIEICHVFARMFFHLVEGLKYAIESSRWQRRLTEAAR